MKKLIRKWWGGKGKGKGKGKNIKGNKTDTESKNLTEG